ncbi:YqzE family protein [Bacillus testis]|uniref:YqzE family protein n=1 Tax=Bacillus testis TaxID=1622072 RepID=UPI00067ECEA1|nr:YqzE family protein [Bacillus testis]
MKTNDFIKFLTQQFVRYFSQSKSVRHEMRKEKKEQRKPYPNQLFGMVPFAIMMLFKGKK